MNGTDGRSSFILPRSSFPRWLLALIVLFATARLVFTYRVFSQTADEPAHVVCGFEWLTTRGYALMAEQPPLARIMFALAAKLDGAQWREDIDDLNGRGTELLYRNGAYRRNLFLARIGNLPFFLLGLFAVYAWAKRLFDGNVALIAAALYSALPPILAHGGLATTDMAAAATVIAALFAFDRWLSNPTGKRAAILGLAIGIALLSKFSFVVFFPTGALALLIARRGRMRWLQIPLIASIAALLIWCGYKFEVGTLNERRIALLQHDSLGYIAAKYASYPGYEWMRPDLVIRYYDYANDAAKRGAPGVDIVDWAKAAGYPSPQAGRAGNTLANAPPLPPVRWSDRVLEPFRRAGQVVVMRVPIPAPSFFVGAEYVAQHSEAGHPAFLLGRYRDQGWWYYFPVVLFFKTPLAFVILAIAGIVLLRRGPIAYIPLLMLVPAMTSRINIGVRHVLPLYPVLAILAAYAAVALWRRSRVATIALLGWYFIATAIAHPDYLPYFNELARHPEEIAVDSNLDWGQDLLRLEQVVRDEHIDHLYISYFGNADWRRHAIPAEELPRERRVRGWIAISEMQLKFGGPQNRGDFRWLDAYEPVRRVGKSIRLYRIDDGGRASGKRQKAKGER